MTGLTALFAVWTAWADCRTRTIPVAPIWFGLGAALAWHGARGQWGAAWAGLLLVGGLGFGLALATEAFGGGDARLLAVWGAWLGPLPGLLLVAGAAGLALTAHLAESAWRRRWPPPPRPFAPWLGVAWVIARLVTGHWWG
ncbi:MAG: prepilin peptidase [Firmicutes bacterium]|nr:prepilin peptidase [Bacillota bacterium]